MHKMLSILVPAYNEEKTIQTVLGKIKEVDLINDITKEVIVIDDCSSDKTSQYVEEFKIKNADLNIRLLNHAQNKGKGAALHTGIKECNGDFIIVQDADLEYDPKEYNSLLKPIIEGCADAVYGSRFMGGGPHRVLFFLHTIGNNLLTFLSNLFTGINLTDMETCYKLVKADIMKSLELKEKRFGFEPELTAKLSKVPNIRIYEVGISYYGRTYKEGKKINWKDGFRALYCIIRYNIFK